MKSVLLTLSILCLFTFQAFSQIFSVELSAQYGAAIFGNIEVQNETLRYSFAAGQQVVLEKEENVFSLGEGFQANLTLNAKLSDNLSFRLKNSYFSNTSNPVGTRKTVFVAGDEILSIEAQATAILFAPMIMFQPSNDNKLKPYMAIGVVGGIVNYQQNETETFLEEVAEYTREYTTPFTIGFQSQFGILYSLNEHFSIRCGADMRMINFHPTNSAVTNYTENGEDQLSTLTTYQKEAEYGDQFLYYDIGNNNVLILSPDDDKPRDAPSFPVPLSSLSLEVGVQYAF